jgi:hypothetical protein
MRRVSYRHSTLRWFPVPVLTGVVVASACSYRHDALGLVPVPVLKESVYRNNGLLVPLWRMWAFVPVPVLKNFASGVVLVELFLHSLEH